MGSFMEWISAETFSAMPVQEMVSYYAEFSGSSVKSMPELRHPGLVFKFKWYEYAHPPRACLFSHRSLLKFPWILLRAVLAEHDFLIYSLQVFHV